ncbi:hypothetical protein [uncultured Duncaniella sp.]|uniref:hypothetical protein n=1 Tax=uncultured Duncaniella sp. TaxID=2768039 RepID=UPI00265DAC6C|nr:hypothetical protein [uncultured Duncaniella sp.]
MGKYYYSHLPVDQDRYAMSLSTLVQSIDNPSKVDYENVDSIFDSESMKDVK